MVCRSGWAGTGDPAGLGGPLGPDRAVAPDIPRTLSRIPAGAFTVVLAHNPALWPSLAQRGVHLTLSGHTHYGQLSIPRIGWSLASLFLEHAMDWHARGQSLLYINPGTNYWGLPLRLGALPEVTVITLMRTASDAPEMRVRCALEHAVGVCRRRRDSLEDIPVLDDLAVVVEPEDIDPGPVAITWPVLIAVQDDEGAV